MKIISVEDMQHLDSRVIRETGLSGNLLMERAGTAAVEKILEFLQGIEDHHVKRFVILAGRGNNGGDAYVVAKHLYENTSKDVLIYSSAPINALKGDARYHAKKIHSDVIVREKDRLARDDFSKGDIIIDGMLGTGFKGKLKSPFDNWIRTINSLNLPVISLDIPSGLNGDTGAVEENAVIADLTITIGLPKLGLVLGQGPEHSGRLEVVDIGFPAKQINELRSNLYLYTEEDAYKLISRLSSVADKQALGSILIIGGSKLYQGAPFLSGKSALKAGAGIVTIAVPETGFSFNSGIFSLITRKIFDDGKGFFTDSSIPELLDLTKHADVIIVGPGMSHNDLSINMLSKILEQDKPMIVDADALNLIAKKPEILSVKKKTKIFTPHLGEAARLLKSFHGEKALDKDRFALSKLLAETLGGVVILKGNKTIIEMEGRIPSVNRSGGPALATAGSGDVLNGIIAANLATKMDTFDAACLGAYVHGLISEIGKIGVRGLIADDIVNLIPEAFRKISPFA